MVLLGEKLIGARGAFLERFLAVALEHEVGGAPDIDLGYHAEKNWAAFAIAGACPRAGRRPDPLSGNARDLSGGSDWSGRQMPKIAGESGIS